MALNFHYCFFFSLNLVDHPEELMPVSSHVSLKYISPEKLGFDEVQLTNRS